MSIAVCGIGIVSAIGIGAGETLGSLRTGRSGIGKPTLLGSAVGVPVGEVKRDNAALGELLGIHSRVIPANRRVFADDPEPLHTLRIVYRAEVTGGQLRHERNGSTDRAEWFALTALPPQRVKLVDIALGMAGLPVTRAS